MGGEDGPEMGAELGVIPRVGDTAGGPNADFLQETSSLPADAIYSSSVPAVPALPAQRHSSADTFVMLRGLHSAAYSTAVCCVWHKTVLRTLGECSDGYVVLIVSAQRREGLQRESHLESSSFRKLREATR